MFINSSSILFKILPAAKQAAGRYGSIRQIVLFGVLLFSILNVSAQLAMPDSVCVGALKHYNVNLNPISGSIYIWSIDKERQFSSSTNEINISWDNEGTYLLEVQEINADGCPGPIQSGYVFVMPVLSIIAISNSPVCEGDSIYLKADSVKSGKYIWSGPNGFSSLSQNPVIHNVTQLNEGTYSLTISTNCNCNYSIPSLVTVIVDNCKKADLSVLNTVDNLHPFIGSSVIFNITATNNGIDNATGVNVIDNILSNGYNYVSSRTSVGTYNHESADWTIGNLNLGETETLTLIATVQIMGSYFTTATISGIETDGDLENNISSNTSYPTEFFIPDGFSPNGDGINDFFVIKGIENYPKNTFIIYNRWGNKVFESSPYNNNWDGETIEGIRLGGNKLPTGTYFYLLDLGDKSKIIKGNIYLNR
jgi:gliding motility-associated-like protein/uncharacterized repeat protein (TIGR01451 family)